MSNDLDGLIERLEATIGACGDEWGECQECAMFREAADELRRLMDAATGVCMAAGDGDYGQPSVVVDRSELIYNQQQEIIALKMRVESLQQAAGVSEGLYAAAKAYYNETIADASVRVTCESSSKRDAVNNLADDLREAIVAALPKPTEVES